MPTGNPLLLLERLLSEQQDLTAVEQFAKAHDARTASPEAKHYQQLLPASPPGPGQQYAFEVDLDRCSGCKACVTACHNLNGLDEQETWRDVGCLSAVQARSPSCSMSPRPAIIASSRPASPPVR